MSGEKNGTKAVRMAVRRVAAMAGGSGKFASIVVIIGQWLIGAALIVGVAWLTSWPMVALIFASLKAADIFFDMLAISMDVWNAGE